MASKIAFQIINVENTFLDPRADFKPTTIKSQVRIDPLTGRTGHFSHFRAIKPQKLDIEKYMDPQVKGFCPFCGDKKNHVTPMFPEGLFHEGRLARGEALLVPNLFPYDVYSSVVIITDDHVVSLENFNDENLYDSFYIGIDFLKKVKKKSPSIPYQVMAWNYMPPSGGGLVHPHQQYFATERPGNQFTDEYKAAELFYNNHRVDYWTELIEEEQRRKDRYIGQVGDTHWLASFISLGVLGEIICVFPGVFCMEDFTDVQVRHLVSGVQKIFCYYRENGIYSFNASLFWGAAGQKFFPAHFRIVPRTFLNTRDYAPDLSFFQTVLQEPVSVVLPEDLGKEVRPFFNKK